MTNTPLHPFIKQTRNLTPNQYILLDFEYKGIFTDTSVQIITHFNEPYNYEVRHYKKGIISNIVESKYFSNLNEALSYYKKLTRRSFL